MNTKYNLKSAVLSKTAGNIELFIQQDPGKRGLANWAIAGSLFPATLSLAGGSHIVITTGFYILSSGAIETDGPPGAVILADALEKMGKEVTIVTDSHAQDIIKVGLDSLGCNAELKAYSVNSDIDDRDIIKSNTTHFIALERPGMARDGKHYNFRGQSISNFVARIDQLFIRCADMGIITIGIGDGGNELGMGNVMERVDSYITPKREFSCYIKSNYCICAGVSNWAGYAIAGLLSLFSGTTLMPSLTIFNKLLDNIVSMGAVDGVSGLKEATVDGLEREWEDSIYSSILDVTRE